MASVPDGPEVTTQLTTDEDGAPVVVQTAPPGPAADRLRRTATRLDAARHPGTIELVRLRDDDAGTELVVRHCAGRPLAEWSPGSPAAALAVAHDLATTLADLHERGIVHGALQPDHVLVTAEQRTVVGGWDAEHRRVPPPTADDDVRAFGRLVGPLAVEWPGTDEARRLRHAATLAGADGDVAPAPMRRVAAALAADPPRPARLRRPGLPRLAVPRPRPRLALRAGGVAGGVAVLLVAVAVAATGRASGVDPAPPPAATPTTTSDPPASTTTSTLPAGPTQVWPAADPPAPVSPCPPVTPPAVPADVDGDGCDDPVTVDGTVVEVAGQRWQVGEPGDVVLLGDWDCDGRATVGLFRPASAELFLFAGFGDATVTPATTAPSATTAAVVSRDGCDHVELRDAAGAVVGST